MKRKALLFFPLISLLVAVMACSIPGFSSVGGDEYVKTSAAQTVDAAVAMNNATGTALALQNPQDLSTEQAPVYTETPTSTATLTATNTVAVISTFTESPSSTPTEVEKACDVATFITDVSVPDNTKFSPGENFTKTWRIKNVGTCTWSTDYEVVFVDGDQMDAPDAVSLAKNVAPDQTIDISLGMVAPSSPGTYKGNWKLRNADGDIFGLTTGNPFYVQIKVVSP
jgi:hypothetical protein